MHRKVSQRPSLLPQQLLAMPSTGQSGKVIFTTVDFINLKYNQLKKKRSSFRQQGGP